MKWAFIGDLCPSGVYSQEINTLTRTLMELRSSIEDDAVLFFNLECSLFDGATGSDTEASEAALRALVALQPAVANLSNNHHFDGGMVGSERIREILFEIGIPSVGLYGPEQPLFDVLNIEEKEVAVVARTARGTHPDSFGNDAEYILPVDHEEVVATCGEVARRYDFCIACLHWGAEYYLRPSPRQRLLTEALVKLGVDVVWGHHAHVLQERCVRDKAVVMYNMGNAVFGQTRDDRWPAESHSAAMVGCRISEVNRVFWERDYAAGIRGESLGIQPSEALTTRKLSKSFWPVALGSWFSYRLYMEVFVFGGRFVAKRLRPRDAWQPPTTAGNGPKANQKREGGLKGVVGERFRRVVSLWEDE